MPLTAVGGQTASYDLIPEPAQARHARDLARKALFGWGLGEHADLAALIVSELVTNAVCHGEGPIWMRLSAGDGDLRVEVHDGGGGRPVRMHAGGGDECGRGLELVDGLIWLHGGERGVVGDRAGPGKTVYVVLSLEVHPGRCAVSRIAGARANSGLGSDPALGQPRDGSGRPVPAAPAPGDRPEICPHAPPCPPPQAPDRQAARIIVSHPEQGWSLLCNAVVVFDDTGGLAPDGSVIEPDPRMCQLGSTQTGDARTAAVGTASGSRQHAARVAVFTAASSAAACGSPALREES